MSKRVDEDPDGDRRRRKKEDSPKKGGFFFRLKKRGMGNSEGHSLWLLKRKERTFEFESQS